MNEVATVDLGTGEIVDRDATEIGDLYARSKASIVDSVRCLIQCGYALEAKKASLNHGEWLPWLQTNEAILGFKERAARRLVELANRSLATDLTPEAALALSRLIWGHTPGQLLVQSNNNKWYTPTDYVRAAESVLGGIDLDPASSDHANEIIGAKKFFTAEDDGLKQEWGGRVWLNPPYGRNAGAFIERLLQSHAAGKVPAAVALVNAHSTDTEWFQPLWDHCLCFTDHRINFHAGDEQNASGSTHGSVFAYLGEKRETFVRQFDCFGAVVARLRV